MGVEVERYGVQIRIKPEVEELVRLVAERLGYLPYTVRNVAILHGLWVVALAKRVVEDDREFEELLESTRQMVRLALGVGRAQA